VLEASGKYQDKVKAWFATYRIYWWGFLKFGA